VSAVKQFTFSRPQTKPPAKPGAAGLVPIAALSRDDALLAWLSAMDDGRGAEHECGFGDRALTKSEVSNDGMIASALEVAFAGWSHDELRAYFK
jgi:hypothetical protein